MALVEFDKKIKLILNSLSLLRRKPQLFRRRFSVPVFTDYLFGLTPHGGDDVAGEIEDSVDKPLLFGVHLRPGGKGVFAGTRLGDAIHFIGKLAPRMGQGINHQRTW
jgi:hypothetical protein